jgi:hypothetical protein
MYRPGTAALVAALALTSISYSTGRTAPAPARSVEWSWRWKPAPGEAAPAAEVCPFRYGKRWAYSVEIDDGPVSTLTVSQPLLAQYSYTDAPPGVPGGRKLPFVGGAAIIVLRTGTPNNTFLNWDQLRTLRSQDWDVLNHGYAHIGNSYEPNGGLNAGQLRRELFWSQAIAAAELGDGRAPTHFVYPNGYTAYEAHLAAFGLRSSSRVAGRSRGNVDDAGFVPADLDRNYLDEGVWSKANNPLAGLPAAPKLGDFVLDFTHGMEADPASPNHRRWQTRLEHLASHYGQPGDDSLWCAPTSEVVNYTASRKAARVQCEPGEVRVILPGSAAGTRLTLHLSGIRSTTALTAPPGGTVYRRGDEAWVTTPVLGSPGAPPPLPHLKRLYRGPLRTVQLNRPERIAGVRVLQHGKPAPGFRLKIDLVGDGGRDSLTDGDPGANWGSWLLFAAVPEREAPLARQIEITPDPSLKELEVWGISD